MPEVVLYKEFAIGYDRSATESVSGSFLFQRFFNLCGIKNHILPAKVFSDSIRPGSKHL